LPHRCYPRKAWGTPSPEAPCPDGVEVITPHCCTMWQWGNSSLLGKFSEFDWQRGLQHVFWPWLLPLLKSAGTRPPMGVSRDSLTQSWLGEIPACSLLVCPDHGLPVCLPHTQG
jgi:hypothetical protein